VSCWMRTGLAVVVRPAQPEDERPGQIQQEASDGDQQDLVFTHADPPDDAGLVARPGGTTLHASDTRSGAPIHRPRARRSIVHGSPPSSMGFTDVPVPERNSGAGPATQSAPRRHPRPGP